MTVPALSRRLRFTALCTALAGTMLAATHSASAVGTRRFELDSQDDFLAGELRGVSVTSQGNVRAGWSLGTVTLAGVNAVWSSLVLSDGSVLLGTGNDGKVLKITGGQVSEYAATKQMAVTSLIQAPGGSVYAATLPSGKIFKIDGANNLIELPAIADAESVWQMVWDAKKGGFYAATGPNGKLFFVQPNGQAQLVFDSDEPHLLSVALAEDGTVYAGSNGKGLVYKITGPGRATILLDPPGDEVKAIATTKTGLWVVSNEMGEVSAGGSSSASSLKPATSSRSASPGRAGKGYLLKVESDGRYEESLARKDTHFVSLALDDKGAPFVGTGVEGRVFTVDENHTSTVMADTESRQVGAMVLVGKTRFIAGSDPAAFYEIRGTGGADSTWTSKVLDAGLRANFGRVFWRSDGTVEIATRTGNSPTPDTTWSDWSQPLSAPGKPSSPPGRFVQLRARFAKDANATLRELSVPFVTDNLRAVVTGIELKGKASGSKTPSSTLPSSGSELPSRSTTLKLSWRTDNPDNDQLRYRVQFRFDGQNVWRDLSKPEDVLTKSEIDWDTSSLPEGTYRIRVEASDETANPPDRVTRHALESGPIVVDNTPPVFRKLATQGRKVVGELVDGIGPIARIDFAVDGRTEWFPLLPKDGVFDEAAEEFEVDLGTILTAGNHLVAIRAYDDAGNQVVRDIELK